MSRLVNDKLALLEKRLKAIEAGIIGWPFWDVKSIDKDEELNEKIQQINQSHENKLKGAQQRYQLRTKSVQIEYNASVEQIKGEHQVWAYFMDLYN